MKITTIKITLPESMKQFVEERVFEGNYTSASKYFRELIRADERSPPSQPPPADEEPEGRPLRRANDLAREFNSASNYGKKVDYA